MPTAFDNGRRSPRKLMRAVVARLLGRKHQTTPKPQVFRPAVISMSRRDG